jgi:hypothetical protein
METRNLIATQSKRVQSMTNALESWQKSVLLSWSGKDYQRKVKN